MSDYGCGTTCLTREIFAEQDPDDTLDYLFNWAAALNDDVISDSTMLLPDGMTEVSSSFTDSTATIFVSGGSCGCTYRITNRITTVGGRTQDKTIYIRIREQ